MGAMKVTSTSQEEDAEPVEIELDSPDVVKNDSYDPLDFKPAIKMGGVHFSIGVELSF